MGRIKSLYTNKILIQNKDSDYNRINLVSNNGNTVYLRVHRLVARSFCFNPDPIHKILVDHIDNKKRNNTAENLRWVTYKENSKYYHENHKEEKYDPVLQYDKDMNLIKEWNNLQDIKRILKFEINTIRGCIRGIYKYASGYIWKYKNPRMEYIIELKDDEVFKNIGIFEGKDFSNYEISNYGNIKSLTKDKYMITTVISKYFKANLINNFNKKQYSIRVHRLVAHCFVEGRTKERNIVNHIDEDKINNYTENLEWVTTGENITHSRGKKINQICIETGEILNTYLSIAHARRELNRTTDISIIKCLSGEYSHGHGFKWELVSCDQ